MNLISDVPDPNDSGVTGTQTVGSAEILADAEAPLSGELLPKTFRGLAAENPKNFGGPQTARLLDAWINDLVIERDRALALAEKNQSKLEQALAELHAARTDNVRLEERIGQNFRLGIAQRLCTFVSPFLFGIAVDVFKNNPNSSYLIFGLSGALLLVNLIPRRGKR